MYRPHVQVFARLRLPDLRTVDLAPEAVIGRMRSATLRLNDPAVSEAHAIVSLRGSTLKLLALRGRFAVDGVQCSEIALAVGQVIELAPRLQMTVVEVVLPPQIFGIRSEGLPLQVLPPVASIRSGTGDVVPGFVPDAEAILWLDETSVHARRVGQEGDVELRYGEALDVADRTYVIERVLLRDVGLPATMRSPLDEPLTLTLLYDSAHIAHGDRVAAVDGIAARILCELAELNGPVEWRTVAREVWPHEDDEVLLRRNWDAGLTRLRRLLLEQGVRSDLVRAAGRGRVEIFLRPRDQVIDRQ